MTLVCVASMGFYLYQIVDMSWIAKLILFDATASLATRWQKYAPGPVREVRVTPLPSAPARGKGSGPSGKGRGRGRGRGRPPKNPKPVVVSNEDEPLDSEEVVPVAPRKKRKVNASGPVDPENLSAGVLFDGPSEQVPVVLPSEEHETKPVLLPPNGGGTDAPTGAGCSRCRFAAKGCKTCLNPNFRPRGPRAIPKAKAKAKAKSRAALRKAKGRGRGRGRKPSRRAA